MYERKREFDKRGRERERESDMREREEKRKRGNIFYHVVMIADLFLYLPPYTVVVFRFWNSYDLD